MCSKATGHVNSWYGPIVHHNPKKYFIPSRSFPCECILVFSVCVVSEVMLKGLRIYAMSLCMFVVDVESSQVESSCVCGGG